MTADIARLEREIAAERADLLANLALLEDRARELADWRRRVRTQPLAAVGAAAVGGFLLAMMTDGRRGKGASQATDGDNGPRSRSRSHLVMDRIVSALAVVAAERAFAALGISMPSVDDEPADERASRAAGRDGEPRTAEREPRVAEREPRVAGRDREPRATGARGP